jgi:GNAT superfamily N-acetyltransferase
MTATAPVLEIVRVHPDDAELFEAWYAAYAESAGHGRGDAADVWQLPELRADLAQDGREHRKTAFAGLYDGAVVAAAMVDLPLLDNRQRAELDLQVRPAQRRRGFGSVMLEHLTRLVAAEGRTILGAEVRWPYDGGTDDQRAGVLFARARGFDLVLEDVQRTLLLPVAGERLDELAARAAARHPSYRLRVWSGPVPEDLLPGWAELNASLDTEAPTGDLAIEPSVVDLEAVREDEDLQRRQGRASVNAVALDAAGEVVAYTQLMTTQHEPDRAYQWGTLVRSADRGHSLGLAVKVAALRRLQEEYPAIRRVLTWNAEVNDHMIAVNVALGYEPTERLGEFQRRL